MILKLYVHIVNIWKTQKIIGYILHIFNFCLNAKSVSLCPVAELMPFLPSWTSWLPFWYVFISLGIWANAYFHSQIN